MLLQRTNRFPARGSQSHLQTSSSTPPPGLSSGDRWIPPSPVYARNLAGAHWQSELCYGRRGDSESDLDIRVRLGVTVTASGTQAGKP